MTPLEGEPQKSKYNTSIQVIYFDKAQKRIRIITLTMAGTGQEHEALF